MGSKRASLWVVALRVIGVAIFVGLVGWFAALQIRLGPDQQVSAVVERLPPSQSTDSGATRWTAYARSPDRQLILLDLPPEHGCRVGSPIAVVRSHTLGGWRYRLGPAGCDLAIIRRMR